MAFVAYKCYAHDNFACFPCRATLEYHHRNNSRSLKMSKQTILDTLFACAFGLALGVLIALGI